MRTEFWSCVKSEYQNFDGTGPKDIIYSIYELHKPEVPLKSRLEYRHSPNFQLKQ